MAATNLEPTDHQRSELQAAFRAFGTVSQQLSGAFDSLRSQVAQLQRELIEARAGREHLAARLSALVESLPGGILVLDPSGRIQEANPAAVVLLGEPLLGEEFPAVLARSAVNSGAIGEHIELRSGRYVNLSRRETSQGSEVVLLTDVTESHLMQVFLTRQQRLLTLGELAAGLAHQIRTPLAAALLYASQMSMPERSPEDLARCAERTVLSLKQLDTLVNDMLAFAHGGAAREVVNISALLEQVAQWLRPALRRGVRLTIRTEAPDLKVRANAPSLVSAVLNLATNALQAATAELDLELLGRRGAPGRAHIVVSDNGPGVPLAIRERIFEPFFTTRARGNGIGLAIVKKVAEAHAGRVHLADTERGAAFIIDLPAEGPHERAQ
jgi:two-component system sensor histidine kinase FlrB